MFRPPLNGSTAGSLTNELALAIACCGPLAENRTTNALHLARKIDWSLFHATCRRHRVQGLVWRALERFGLTPPEYAARKFAADAAEIATRGLMSADTCAKLSRVFEAADIRVLFVKGLTLSKLAYGDPFLKMSNDIDVLVPTDLIARAAAELASMGYVPTVPRNQRLVAWHVAHKESVWTRHGHPTIELHSRLADNPRLIPDIGITSPVQQVKVADGITLTTLAQDELITYLCVHGFSSAWFRLKWIADLAALLSSEDTTGLRKLVNCGVRHKAGRTIPAALLLSNCLFGTFLSRALVVELSTLSTRLLMQIAVRELRDQTEPTQQRFGTLPIHLSQLLSSPGLLFYVSELTRQCRGTISRS